MSEGNKNDKVVVGGSKGVSLAGLHFFSRRTLKTTTTAALTIVVIAGGYYGYHTWSVRHKKALVLSYSNQAANLVGNNQYNAAAQRYIQAYNKAGNSDTKGNLANNIGQTFVSAKDYSAALQWYRTSLSYFKQANDSDGISDAQDGITQATYYQQAASKPKDAQPTTTDGGP